MFFMTECRNCNRHESSAESSEMDGNAGQLHNTPDVTYPHGDAARLAAKLYSRALILEISTCSVVFNDFRFCSLR